MIETASNPPVVQDSGNLIETASKPHVAQESGNSATPVIPAPINNNPTIQYNQYPDLQQSTNKINTIPEPQGRDKGTLTSAGKVRKQRAELSKMYARGFRYQGHLLPPFPPGG